ncbi:MAG TPA: hypothetical protein VF389_06075, partial [Woeseiaceae bacterium]
LWEFPLPTRYEATASTLAANTGTVDTEVAKRRADNDARQPLLYAAIGAIAAAVGLMFMGWPKVATLAGVAGGIFFVAWQAAAAPPWLWYVGGALLAIGAGVFIGWWRRDADGDGIPDRLQRKPS